MIFETQSNISRSLSADMRSVSEYNGINSYCMVHFIYRLNIFGSKAARRKMMNSVEEVLVDPVEVPAVALVADIPAFNKISC